ncbi:MAG: deoxycytidylate deaminase [Alphaproteobacteria bacterium]|nr:deoxycytidylate deaminase [Alphaproteobacteria bacterium]
MMQSAVDIVGESAHPVNPVAAALAGSDRNGAPFSLAMTNEWPPSIRDKIGTDTRIGNASGTVHAETACLLHAPRTDGASLFVTDPPCPNCVKYMAEAGIKALYIDHKGFEKDYAQRRGHDFEQMSLRICRAAGIAVVLLFRKEQRLQTLLEIPDEYKPAQDKPVGLTPFPDAPGKPILDSLFHFYVRSNRRAYDPEPFAMALARATGIEAGILSAEPCGMAGREPEPAPEGKYNFTLQPLNRLMMSAARRGLRINPDFVYSSRVPTSRELVNMVAAGLNRLTVGDRTAARDEHGPRALDLLEKAGIIKVSDGP